MKDDKQSEPRQDQQTKQLPEEIAEIVERCIERQVIDNRSADEIVGYDDKGIPS